MCTYSNLVKNFGEAIVTFVAMPETRQMAQPKELNATNINRKGAAPHRKIGLPPNSLETSYLVVSLFIGKPV